MRPGVEHVLVLCALGAMFAGDANAFRLRGSVLGNGGTSTSGGLFRLVGTAGQAHIGRSSGSPWVANHGYWGHGGPGTVSVDPPNPGTRDDLPTTLEFGPATPNPARANVGFALALPMASDVKLVVFDLQGRKVSELASELLDPGRYRLEWGPRGGAGIRSGMYFARLLIDGRSRGERRFVLIE